MLTDRLDDAYARSQSDSSLALEAGLAADGNDGYYAKTDRHRQLTAVRQLGKSPSQTFLATLDGCWHADISHSSSICGSRGQLA